MSFFFSLLVMKQGSITQIVFSLNWSPHLNKTEWKRSQGPIYFSLLFIWSMLRFIPLNHTRMVNFPFSQEVVKVPFRKKMLSYPTLSILHPLNLNSILFCISLRKVTECQKLPKRLKTNRELIKISEQLPYFLYIHWAFFNTSSYNSYQANKYLHTCSDLLFHLFCLCFATDDWAITGLFCSWTPLVPTVAE